MSTNSNSATIPSTGQTLAISLTAPDTSTNGTVSLQGLVSRSTVSSPHFNIAYVIDRSGSMSGTFRGTEAVPDLNGDGDANTLMDAAINSFTALTASLDNAGFGSSTLGVIDFDDTVQTSYSGTLNADADSNGTPDAVESLSALRPGGATYYDLGLQGAIDFFNTAQAARPGSTNVLFFISDGEPNGGDFSDEVSTLRGSGIDASIRAIGLGSGSSLTALDLVDDGQSNGSATQVDSPSTLTAGLIAPPVNAADIDHVELLRNGTVVETIDAADLTSTPLGLQFSSVVTGLSPSSNTLTARVYATDAADTNVAVDVPVTFPVVTRPAGVTITAQDGYVTTEDGSGVHFSVSLDKAVTAGRQVVISFTSSDTTEGVVTTPTLTFNSTNWNRPQVLEVNGVQDYETDGTVTYQVRGVIAAATTDVDYLDYGRRAGIPAIDLRNAPDVTDSPDIDRDRYTGGVDRDIPQIVFETVPMNNVFYGLDNNDRLYGGYLMDDLNGGRGDDRLYGGYDDDRLYGGDGNDRLYGEQDDDRLEGGAGNDILDGGLGRDTLIGGPGNDTYYLGYDETDVIDDRGLATDVDTVIMPYVLTSYTLPNGIENGAIAPGTAAATLTGNSGNNGLTGNDGSNTLDGGTGNDSLNGGGGTDNLIGGTGNDTLVGGAGNDTLNGGTGTDAASYASATATVTINLTTNRATGSQTGTDTLVAVENATGGTANDTLVGSTANNGLSGGSGNDSLNGGAGNDTLVGGTGNDTLIGGAGSDTLTGNAGADNFKFISPSEGTDRITDFTSGTDKIQVVSANFGTPLRFATAAPTTTAATFVYNQTTGALSFDSNGNRTGGVSAIASLGANTNLVAGDFQVVTA